MRIAKIVGTVTLSRCHDTFVGASLRLAVPMTLPELRGETQPAADEIVVWDDLGAGLGSMIAVSEGGEAAQPFRPKDKPVDAYAAAIFDDLRLDP
ncbi:Ethanolamine utilization protein EutN/carboxysome structural protein Ccml [Pirellula staleyi DSM 6068]|uniref:Ethanolamine utilization protein EutN/carboxysome structural protein Ccml n=1 Tax=Pirellula staleyi (strain ATCC 27377 / DSM 6068 / ICPB 4128) TaxID=530564 RepID=D2QXB1_PIRSD|nr:EutN/CcmL family microcompartment protein [Pirellula staleyi]ADB17951.1 Ethanolamine utilization protein EutN/carboxysome structural protein Ccml [Pirellula staleyi DSM 6068]